MSDYYKAPSELKSRRSKTSVVVARTVNNNIKGFSTRRRNRGNRIKSAYFNVDDMPVPGNMADRDVSPRQSPVSDDKGTRDKPERQYSRDELIELMTHPLSSMKHPCLEFPQNKSLVSGKTGARWLEDRWDNRRRTDSLTDEDRSDGSLDPQKKRMNDPKAERLRKDQEVVLSPQRRSFNSGCFVNLPPQSVSNNRRPESPHKGDRESGHREIPSRRIGSGRIMRDPVWDFRNVEKEEVASQSINNHDFSFRQRDDRFERRSYERSHDKERPQQRNSRYNNDRKKAELEEPEWFSGGPTSQHDTIELHGFDGPVDEKTTTSKKQNKNNKNSSKNNRKPPEKIVSAIERKNSSRKSSPETITQPRQSSPKPENQAKLQQEPQVPPPPSFQKQQPQDSADTKNQKIDSVFNIEDFLNFDSLPPLLSMTNGCVEEGGSGSRFSQFFRRESPSPKKMHHQPDSQHSSAQDEMFNSMINDITNNTNITIPLDGDTYFAPISPAAPSVKEDVPKGPPTSLLEMLQRGNQTTQGRKITKRPSIKDLEVSGKIHSVEELEARLRQEQGVGKPAEFSNRPMNKEEELAAFQKLMMRQVQNLQEVKPSHTATSGAFQSQQPQAQHGLPQQSQHGMSQQQTQQMPIPHDLVMKLLHVQQQQRQQEAFAKLLAPPGRQFNVPPPMAPLSPEIQMHINNSQPPKDLLQLPEAQTIIRSLKRGDITVVHLIEQLKRNTPMQPMHREMIAHIIKLHCLQTGAGQREPSPANLVPPTTTEQLLHQMMHNQQTQHQQQQLRIPSPHANMLQRVPSPRELVAHTQNILQNALLKKKLEEQKENFRKRQEMQRSHSPNVSLGGPGTLSPANQHPSTTSPTPLAFTPTSVLRKMTADKEGDLSQQPPKQGRAIVKGSGNYSMPPPAVPPPMDYMSMPPQYRSVQRNKIQQSPRNNNPPQHFMMGVNRNNNMQPPQGASSAPRGRSMGGSTIPQQQQSIAQTVTQMLIDFNQHQCSNTILKPDCQPMVRGRNYNMGYAEGSSSPVSNQLARWFSPELLAQARAGKLPDMPPISPTQNMLSVEELERLQQAVHN